MAEKAAILAFSVEFESRLDNQKCMARACSLELTAFSPLTGNFSEVSTF
jgi:hypothetical protein